MMILIRLFLFIDLANSLDISHNLPKFCPTARWDSKPKVLVKKGQIDGKPVGIYVDIHDTVYATSEEPGEIIILRKKNPQSMQKIRNLPDMYSIFVTLTGDIYTNDASNKKVVKRNLNLSKNIAVMNVEGQCTGLFLDINNAIYCSIAKLHQVIKSISNNNLSTTTVAAGTGKKGTNMYSLNKPYGIFVHTNFTLYVADSKNARIQRFHPGQNQGTTVIGRKTTDPISLKNPRGVVLDGNDDLYIVDTAGYIFRFGSNGYQCLVGCHRAESDTESSENRGHPGLRRLSFDNHGNILVTDYEEKQILEFSLVYNGCNKSSNTANPITTNPITSSIIAVTTTKTKTNNSSLTVTLPESTALMTTRRPSYFVPKLCPNKSHIGSNCSISNTPCALLEPCQNGNSCKNALAGSSSYQCICSDGFYGDKCKFSRRRCQTNPCWNNGQCEESHSAFICRCTPGWTGKYCQWMENYCQLQNITCQNRGVCRPLLRDFKCECLAAKSISSIAIIIMISAASFFIIMDVLKYCFGVDVTREEREEIRRKKRLKKRKPVIERFVYINPPASAETTV